MGKGSRARDAEQARERRQRIEAEEKKKKQQQNRVVYGALGALLLLIVIGVIIAVVVSNAGKPKEKTPETEEVTGQTDARNAPAMSEIDLSNVDDPSVFTVSEEPTDYVRLTVRYTAKDGVEKDGNIYIRLFPDVAPETVANFKTLVGQGFYNGLTFHRVYPGFMIQGGDPKGDGTGNSGTNIRGEFSANGFENNLSHVRGVLSMARGGDSMDSASCQFFIVHQDSAASSLDGRYAGFGYVVSGMDVVDAITGIELESKTGSIDRVATSPVHPVTIESAVFVTK